MGMCCSLVPTLGFGVLPDQEADAWDAAHDPVSPGPPTSVALLSRAWVGGPHSWQEASAPGRTRTPNLRIRSPLLYPVELQGLGDVIRPRAMTRSSG